MRAKKVDGNQKRLVEQLRQIPGVSVLHLHQVGKGCPDVAVGFKNKTFLVEIKNDKLKSYEKGLTGDQEKFISKWTGHVAVAETLEDVLKIIEL